jgi:hypothetical protein
MDPLTVGGKAALIQHLPCPDVGETFQVINVYLVLGDQGVLVQWGGDASSESTFKGILEAMDLP